MRNSMDAQEVAVGWWPGDARYPNAGVLRLRPPAPGRLREAPLAPGRWDATLGEFLLDWDDVLAAPDPRGRSRRRGLAARARSAATRRWRRA